MRTPDVDLAGRKEDVDSDVDEQASLDFSNHLAGNDVLLGVVCDHRLPLADAVGLSFREDDQSEVVFDFLEQYLDGRTRLWHLEPFFLTKLFERYNALTLVADVDQDVVTFLSEDDAVDDRVQFIGFRRRIVDRIHRRFGIVEIELSAKDLLQFFVGDVEFTNEITVDHE